MTRVLRLTDDSGWCWRLIKAVPQDPRYKADNAAWVDYVYTRDPAVTGNNLDYEITTCLENKGDLEKVVSPAVIPCASEAGVIMKVTTP
jgi:hypothetical protein